MNQPDIRKCEICGRWIGSDKRRHEPEIVVGGGGYKIRMVGEECKAKSSR